MGGLQRAMDALYARSMPGAKGPLRALHRRLFRSALPARLLFATRVRDDTQNYVMDLTSILLRNFLKPQVRRHPDLRVLELGVGRFAIPSGYLSRYSDTRFDAVDVKADAVASAQAVIEENAFNVRVWQSDLLTSVPAAPYDLIFWNLPYYRDPELFARFFASVPPYLSSRGTLVLGYNAIALPRERLIAALEGVPELRVVHVRTWGWNRHEILVLKQVATEASGSGGSRTVAARRSPSEHQVDSQPKQGAGKSPVSPEASPRKKQGRGYPQHVRPRLNHRRVPRLVDTAGLGQSDRGVHVHHEHHRVLPRRRSCCMPARRW